MALLAGAVLVGPAPGVGIDIAAIARAAENELASHTSAPDLAPPTNLTTIHNGQPQAAAGSRRTASKGHGAKSDALRERAVIALLSSRTIALAAKEAGVGERTLRTWMRDPQFQADLAAARRATFEAGMSRVQALAARAVGTLEDLLDCHEQPSARLGAARTLIELGVNRHDADTLLQRIADLEQQQGAGPRG